MGKSIQDTLAGYSKWNWMNDIPGAKARSSPDINWVKKHFISLFLVSCAYYKIVGDHTWHHTGEIFQIGRYLNNSDTRKTFAFKVGENVPTGEIILVRVGRGDYAD